MGLRSEIQYVLIRKYYYVALNTGSHSTQRNGRGRGRWTSAIASSAIKHPSTRYAAECCGRLLVVTDTDRNNHRPRNGFCPYIYMVLPAGTIKFYSGAL